MTKRERKARMLASVVHRDAWPSYVLAAGLLAALNTCRSEKRSSVPWDTLIRDRILDAMEKANGGPL